MNFVVNKKLSRITTTPPRRPARPSPLLFCRGTSCLLHPSTSATAAAAAATSTTESYGDFDKTMTEIKANEVLLACSIGDISWLKKGLANGCNPSSTNKEGLTGLHIAAKNGHYECLKYLLNNCGVNVNLLSKQDRVSPLHCSVMMKNSTAMYQCMKVLLDRGADHSL